MLDDRIWKAPVHARTGLKGDSLENPKIEATKTCFFF